MLSADATPLYGQDVGLTGIIYASIVVAWAAYLVPLALRRHDEAARSRSIERFSSSMRVLSRHDAAGSGRIVVTPPRQADRVVNPGLARTGSTAVASTVRAPRLGREASSRAACRRRRVLIGLLLGAALVAAAAVLGVLPMWSVAVPVAMVAGFLFLARRQVSRISDSYWVAAHAASPAPSNVVRRSSSRVDATHGAAKSADDEPTVPLDAEDLKAGVVALEQERSVAVFLPTADGGSLWDPVPIVLPTYVDKPVARSTIRTVELGEPAAGRSDQWARMREPVAVSASSAPSDAFVEDEISDVKPARVVNG